MSWLRRWGMRRAAKRYARKLPQELHADWGLSDFYTAAQIKAALARTGLGGPHVAIAYAAFLTESDYLDVAKDLPHVVPYDTAREYFERGRPWAEWSGYQQGPISNAQAAARYGIGGFG